MKNENKSANTLTVKSGILATVAVMAVALVVMAGGFTSCQRAAAEKQPKDNPIIWADAPDPDVMRVGDDYYMVTTTMHLMPGAPIMHSRDLVNWETIGYVFDRLTDTPRYDLVEGTVYGKGQWATSLKYHDGKYYVLFSPNDEPYKSYIFTAENPAGPWQLLTHDLPHFHDSSFLFDDDGKVYVYYGGGNIRIRELNSDLSGVKEGGLDQIAIVPDSTETGLHEGTHVVKHDGKYYALVISWPAGRPRRQVCYRSDSVAGPWEKEVILESQFGGFPYVGQGTIVDGKDGEWWGMIFQDRGGVGRVLTLNPVTWKDGWPMLGDEDGKVPATVEVVQEHLDGEGIAASDDFADGKKSILWQWNHNPIDSAWSLTERDGWLRLKTQRVVGNVYEAPNTISQRMPGPTCEGEILLDISAMKPGDVAGFAAFNGDSGLLEVVREADKTWLVALASSVELSEPGHYVSGVRDTEMERVDLGDAKQVWLKIKGDFNPGRDIATMEWSLDGTEWKPIGEDFKMIFDYRRMFMGTRFAIFNYATQEAGGYVDVDYFKIS